MVSDGSVEVRSRGIGYEFERELGKFVDCVGFQNGQRLDSKSLGEEPYQA